MVIPDDLPQMPSSKRVQLLGQNFGVFFVHGKRIQDRLPWRRSIRVGAFGRTVERWRRNRLTLPRLRRRQNPIQRTLEVYRGEAGRPVPRSRSDLAVLFRETISGFRPFPYSRTRSILPTDDRRVRGHTPLPHTTGRIDHSRVCRTEPVFLPLSVSFYRLLGKDRSKG